MSKAVSAMTMYTSNTGIIMMSIQLQLQKNMAPCGVLHRRKTHPTVYVLGIRVRTGSCMQ